MSAPRFSRHGVRFILPQTLSRYLLPGFLLASLCASAMAAERYWEGAAGNGLWSTDANWSAPPAVDGTDGIRFDKAAGGITENDFSGAIFDKLYFDADAGAYTLNGNKITLINGGTNGIRNNSAFVQTINLDIDLAAAGSNAIGAYTADLVINGSIGGIGSIGFAAPSGGTAKTVYLNGANTFSGGLAISNSRSVHIGNARALGTGVFTVSGGELMTLGSGISTFYMGGLAGSGAFALNDTAGDGVTFRLEGGVDASRGGVISGKGGLVIALSNGATQSLAGANTYTGGTVIESGTLDLASASGNITGALTINGGSLSIARLKGGSKTTTVSSLNGTGGRIVANTTSSTGAAANATLIVNTTTQNRYDGSLQDDSGILALTKRGSGSLVLGGLSTHTGNTRVEGGSLGIEGRLTGSMVSVAEGAKLVGLGGEIDSTLTLENNSHLAFTLTNTTHPLLEVGSAALGSNVNLELTLGAVLAEGTKITLLNADGVLTGLFATINGVAIGEDSRFWLEHGGASYEFQLTQGANAVSLTAIPEPGALPLLSLAGLLGLAIGIARQNAPAAVTRT